jgi:hypothetical protein
MNEDTKLDDANTEKPKWLAGCAICNEGLHEQMKKLVKKHKLSQVTAAKQLAEVIEKQIGDPYYSADALRKRYQREERKHAGQNDQATKPKDKSGTTAKAKGNRKIPGPSSTLNIPRPRSKPEPELAPDTFQNLLGHAQALTAGLQSWCDGEINPNSDQDRKTAQAILDALADIIRQYKRLSIIAQTEGERQEDQTTE